MKKSKCCKAKVYQGHPTSFNGGESSNVYFCEECDKECEIINDTSAFFCNTSSSVKGRSKGSRGVIFWLDKIKELNCGSDFDKLEAFCTDGDFRPPYPYQWRATSTLIAGEDDPSEGLGGNPLEALRNLYYNMKVNL